jgi:hypothetical protein
MKTPLLTLADQIPKVRLVWSLLWFELTDMSSLSVVARLAGGGTVLPSGLTTLALWQYVVQCSSSIITLNTTVLAKVLISQEDVALAQSHGAFGLLIFLEHDNGRHTGFPRGRMNNPIVVPLYYFDFIQNEVAHGFLPIYRA